MCVPWFDDDFLGDGFDGLATCARCRGEDAVGPYYICSTCQRELMNDGDSNWLAALEREQARQRAVYGPAHYACAQAWALVTNIIDLRGQVDPARLERILERALDRYERRLAAASTAA